MRDIPTLQTLCLRMVGSHQCSTETTFAPSSTSSSSSFGKEEEIEEEYGGGNGTKNTTTTKMPSPASRLLRSFHRRPTATTMMGQDPYNKSVMLTTATTDDAATITGVDCIPLERTPCIGKGSFRRIQANDVDLNLPFVAARCVNVQVAKKEGTTATAADKEENNSSTPQEGSTTANSTTTTTKIDTTDTTTLVLDYGNPALDCLQSIIDALVELGRMDDTRLGKHFFTEWVTNVQLAATQTQETTPSSQPTSQPSHKKKRRRTSGTETDNNTTTNTITTTPTTPIALGGLSLYNCTLSPEMMEAMVQSNIGPHLAVVDLTGVHGLHDELLTQHLLPTAPHLQRISLKNCRRITVQTLRALANYQGQVLQALDIGGAFNITAEHVLEVLPALTKLNELHASGLGWNNTTIHTLMTITGQTTTNHHTDDDNMTEMMEEATDEATTTTTTTVRPWNKLSLGFSFQLSATALRQSLRLIATTLISLAIPFCENCVDNALLGMLGRNLPAVQYLDVRGNSSVTTLTGWYDGRASANLSAQPLLVLGRFSGLSDASVEETRRVHPLEALLLTVILDGTTGAGSGITRTATMTTIATPAVTIGQ
jgi:hypothetical protein